MPHVSLVRHEVRFEFAKMPAGLSKPIRVSDLFDAFVYYCGLVYVFACSRELAGLLVCGGPG